MTHLLVVTRSIPEHPRAGGMERVAWDLAVELARSWEVTVLTTRVPGRPSTYVSEGVRVIASKSRPGRYSFRFWRASVKHRGLYDFALSVSAAGTARVLLGKKEPMIVQSHGTAWRGIQAQRGIHTLHAAYTRVRLLLWIWLDIAAYRACGVVAACSDSVAKDLRSWPYARPTAALRITAVPNGVDAGLFCRPSPAERAAVRAAFGIPQDVRVASVTCRLVRQKGVDRLLKAVAVQPDLWALVGGDGPERNNLETQARDLGIEERVKFLGACDRATVRDVLWASDVAALPVREGRQEGLPLTALEAIACGIPVVASEGVQWPSDLEPLIHQVEPDTPVLGTLLMQARAAGLLPARYTLEAAATRYRELLLSAR